MAELAEGRSVAVDAAISGVWPAKRAELLGIVMAELLTNALQYGRGAVHVRFFDAAACARLEVSSGHPVSPSALAAGQASSAGLRIAAALLREHGGALTVHQTGQTVQAVAEFPWPSALP
ncbi:MAG: ATP-binding protein [Alphaproteobacteria bacterium]|nr:ATP-binding protein [Alphaproteobacteria bacterium]